MSSTNTKFFCLAGLCFLASISFAQAQTLINASFPDGTGTNATFLEIDNGVGDGMNSWTQETGVLFSTTANNSTAGAASEATIDFTALGSESLTLSVDVASVSGGLIANGIFVGFQRRVNEGTGADLWNNLPVSFGLVIPGSTTVGNGVRVIGVGGNAGSGRYQGSNYGVASLASIQDGFSMLLTVSSDGWEMTFTGLEDDAATAITGGSGTWGIDGINTWADFPNDMRVGASYQTPAAGGDFSLSKINLVAGSGGPLFQILSVERDENPEDPGATITWASVAGIAYSIDFSIDLKSWPEITDGKPSDGDTTTFTHKFLPLYPELENAPRVYYRIRLNQ
ncbi:MAG: hypothetical protein ACI8XO_000507 [Verrucomicrobiales bacterium]|jgi:hypothetical protein